MTDFIVGSRCLQRTVPASGVGRFVIPIVEELHRRGRLTAMVFDAELGPPPTHAVAVPAEIWVPSTRLAVRRLARSASPVYLAPWDDTDPSTADDHRAAGLPIASLVDAVRRTEPHTDGLVRSHGAPSMIRTASVVLTTSPGARRVAIDTLDLDPDRVVDIGVGLPRGLAPTDAPTTVAWRVHELIPAIDRPFALAIGDDAEPRIVRALFDAWSRLPNAARNGFRLVVASRSGAVTPHIGWLARTTSTSARSIVSASGLTDQALRMIQHGARLSIDIDDRAERAPMSALSAMATGTPTIVSSESALAPEVGPRAIVDLARPEEMARAIGAALTDDDVRRHLLEVGKLVTAPRTWLRAVDALEHAVTEATSTATHQFSTRARLALVGPFRPSRTGVGDYNTRLVRALQAHADVDCFVDGDWKTADVAGAAAFPISDLGRTRRPAEYDAVFVVIGNSAFHAESYDVLARCDAFAWFHEINLAALHAVRAHMRCPEEPAAYLRAMLRRCYGDEARQPTTMDDHHVLGRERFFMAADAARSARRTIVSSAHSRTLLELDSGGMLPTSPIVLPLAFPAVTRRPGRSGRAERPTIVSLGMLDEVKRPGVLVEAVAKLPAARRPRLVFAGPEALREPDRFRNDVRRLGIECEVTVTGWLSDDDYRAAIDQADLVVQLRSMSYGESSAAVVDAIAAGCAVVTSVAAFAGLPAGIVHNVAEDVSADDLAAVLGGLLDDDEEREQLGRAARTHAEGWSFDDLAATILEIASEPPT